MLRSKPRETPSIEDLAVIALSPVFVASLVGSLVFFLLDVFYQGENEGGIRWMMFWYVIAIVAVARISVDRGLIIANVYGLALAVTTWLYISYTHQGFMLGIVLLAFIWWCAHRLVTDCSKCESFTPKDTSLGKVSGILGSYLPHRLGEQKRKDSGKNKQAGIWIVYFSMAAVPLFGIGKVLLPGDETQLRSRAGLWLALYLFSAFILLISTRFLNLRQTLRKRRKEMPTHMAIQWFYSGLLLILIVSFVSWLAPRPGSTQQWAYAAKTVNVKIQEASQWAMQWNPPGTGEGMEQHLADQLGDSLAMGMNGEEGNQGQQNPQDSGNRGQPNNGDQEGRPVEQAASPPLKSVSGGVKWLQWLFWITAIILIAWAIYKNRVLLTSLFSEWWTALCRWLRNLGNKKSTARDTQSIKHPKEKPQLRFKDFKNPFTHSKAESWGDMEIIHYTMDAFQAWLKDQQTKPLPSDTPVEQLQQWQNQYPDAYDILHYLYSHHTHAGFGKGPRSDFDKGTLEGLWNWMQRA